VGKLIPDAIPGNSWSDIVLAKANYSKLDNASSPVRIRLNSTAVRVKHLGIAASAKEVEVTDARGDKLYTLQAKNSILACWHVVIPYICEELPAKQKEALGSAPTPTPMKRSTRRTVRWGKLRKADLLLRSS
jgi:spermidine dehydrogenase